MEISLILLKKLGIMFISMIVGFSLSRADVINKKGDKYLSNFLLYIIFPVVIINSFAIKRTEKNFYGFLDSFFLAIVSILLSMIVSYIIYEKYAYKKTGKAMRIDDVGVAFSSAGFMGIPIVSSMFGKDAVFFASSFAAILTFLQWTYGVMLIADSKDYIKAKKIFLNPVLISMVTGIIIYISDIHINSAISSFFNIFSYLNAPVVMIILGIYLDQIKVFSMFKEKSVYLSSILRLVLIPVLTALTIKFLPGNTEIKLITMIAASAPVGSNVAIFARLYGGDYTKAVKIVCMSTILSVITMPVIIGFSNFIFK